MVGSFPGVVIGPRTRGRDGAPRADRGLRSGHGLARVFQRRVAAKAPVVRELQLGENVGSMSSAMPYSRAPLWRCLACSALRHGSCVTFAAAAVRRARGDADVVASPEWLRLRRSARLVRR